MLGGREIMIMIMMNGYVVGTTFSKFIDNPIIDLKKLQDKCVKSLF